MWGLLVFVIGLLVGYFTPGRTDRWYMVKVGLVWGVVLALVFALLGAAINAPALGIGGMVGIVVSILVLTLLMVLGTWCGDLIERAVKGGPGAGRRRERRAV